MLRESPKKPLRILCSMYQAVFCVIPSSRWSFMELTPLRLVDIM